LDFGRLVNLPSRRTANWSSTNTEPGALKALARERKYLMLAGSECGCKAMPIAFKLFETAKLNDVDP
jgi:hypothetical protein